MNNLTRYDLDHPDDEEARQLAEEHRRRVRFKAHYKKWGWLYDLKDAVAERFMMFWTVGVVYGTLRFIAAIILCLSILITGYHLLSTPNASRELPTVEEIMKLDHE